MTEITGVMLITYEDTGDQRVIFYMPQVAKPEVTKFISYKRGFCIEENKRTSFNKNGLWNQTTKLKIVIQSIIYPRQFQRYRKLREIFDFHQNANIFLESLLAVNSSNVYTHFNNVWVRKKYWYLKHILLLATKRPFK